MALLDWLLQREVVITLAIVGAVVATAGSHFVNRASTDDPRFARLVLKTGYGITFTSIALFIVAGFRAGW